VIDPSKLVATARILNSDQGSRPPETEAIRRAVSTAYYALFHKVLQEGAERFVGSNDTSVAFETIYRGFDHSQINRVFVAIDKQSLSDAYKKRLRRTAVSQDIRDFAAVFVPMQELRHLADYSPLMQISQAEATQLIDNVEAALQTFSNADPAEKADLLALMLVGTRAS
jgi:uncharacterized protein (UPF0332 family)